MRGKNNHFSMNIKMMYIVLTISAPVSYCFNDTQGTDRDHFLTHIVAGLATLCKSPVLDREKKKKKKKKKKTHVRSNRSNDKGSKRPNGRLMPLQLTCRGQQHHGVKTDGQHRQQKTHRKGHFSWSPPTSGKLSSAHF